MPAGHTRGGGAYPHPEQQEHLTHKHPLQTTRHTGYTRQGTPNIDAETIRDHTDQILKQGTSLHNLPSLRTRTRPNKLTNKPRRNEGRKKHISQEGQRELGVKGGGDKRHINF
ncbi:Hypothetical predicted protein [Pelobates cultripes]|uniref:Uncharacterized protein n=1 Tax=Pelobates cultripes TaxID=61616 RepID=A0AAD1QZI5_PELCU|nr:Hypothetical predicted protein [Pelobates cultripes]